MKQLSNILILIIVVMTSCSQTKEIQIQFGEYNMVGLGGLYGEHLELKSDSTFKFRTSVCLSHTLAEGKFRKINNRLYFYDIENLSKPMFYDSTIFIKIDTQYLYLPNGTKRIISKPDTFINRFTYGNENLSDRVPNNVKIRGKVIVMYGSDNRTSGSLTFLKRN
jgi:hypothetical protein